MTGVEILTSNEVAIKYAFNWTAFWITGSLILGLFTIMGVSLWINAGTDWCIIPILFTIGLFSGIVFGFIIGDDTSEAIEYTTEYKVAISDEVSMNEFYEHYEVIEQDGKIFTVREKK